ncbi:hypothetical protein O6H91_11G084400 [Diphasiastrum complanatum]|uniref:Uncharacterized protein n=1 Tax=Diphasiastrum complanatum TaxID=34168 RepID=A0ACC2CBF0_DIPCM|nr:hypothetical protein O6H91_11G084400 [Diphasiastrum complanatum]
MQLRELHRLYNVQKLLMNETRRGGLLMPPASSRDRSLQFSVNCTPIGLGGGGQSKDHSNELPLEGASSNLKLDYHKELQVSVHENVNTKSSLDIFGKPVTFLQDGRAKATKRTFDLERPPEEYMDDEVHNENSAQEQRVHDQNTETYKEACGGYSKPDSNMFLSLKTSSKEETSGMACVSPSRSSFKNLDGEHAKLLKRSRCTEEGCHPSSDIPDPSTKSTVSSQQNFLGATSGVNLEKSSDQESRSSWNADDACSDGSKKKVRASLNFDVDDIPQEIRKAQWDSQGSMKSQAVFLNGAPFGQSSFMQDSKKSKAASQLHCQPELHGGAFLEGKLAGQPWWKVFQAHKEVEMQSSGGMYGYYKTTTSSNAGGKSQGAMRLNATSYGIHPLQGKLEAADKPVSFHSWRESEPAASRMSTGIYAQGHGSTVRTGASSETTLRNGQSHLSHSMATAVCSGGGRGIAQEGMTGLWYQPRTDFSQFSQLQQQQPLTVLQTSPASSQTQVSWQTPVRVASNGTYSSSGGFFPISRESSLVECHVDGAQKTTEDFSSNSWSTTSAGGSRFPTFAVVPSQKPPFNKPPKLVLDGNTMELKLASSDIAQVEKVIQSKAPGSSLHEEHLQPVSRGEGVQESSNNTADQNIGLCSDSGFREAFQSTESISRDAQFRLIKEWGSQVAQPDSYNVRHAHDGLSRVADQGILKEFGLESKAISSHMSKSGLDLELRPGSLLDSNEFTIMSVPAYSGESLSSSKAMWMSQDIKTSKKTSVIDEGAGLSTSFVLNKLQDNLVKAEREESNFPKASRIDTPLIFGANASADKMSDVDQIYSPREVGVAETEDNVKTYLCGEAVSDAKENFDYSKSDFNRPVVVHERLTTDQSHTKVEKPMNTARNEARHKGPLENFPTDLGKVTLEEEKGTESLQGTEIRPLKASPEQQSIRVEEQQPFKVGKEQLKLVASVATEGLNKPRACVMPKCLTLDGDVNNGPLSREPESKLLSSSESLDLTTPEEEIVASFGSTVTTVEEDMLNPTSVEPNLCEGGSVENYGSDHVAPAENSPHEIAGTTNSKSVCFDSLVVRQSSKASEASEENKILPASMECNGRTAVVSHSSTLTSTATPAGQQCSEASSKLHESSTNVAGNTVPDERISTNPKSRYVPEKTPASIRPTAEDNCEDDHSLCLDESANLAASILVSLLPIASLPSKGSDKERACSPLQKSSSSSADHLAQLGNDRGNSGGCNTTRKPGPSSLKLKYDALHSKIQISSLEEVCNAESMKKESAQRPRPVVSSNTLTMKGGDDLIHEEHGSGNQDKSSSQKKRESAQWPNPDFDSTSLNTKGDENVLHEQHGMGNPEKLSSQKNAGAATAKRRKLSKKCHQSKTLPSDSSLRTPEAKSGEALNMDARYNKHLVRNGSVAGCACYAAFEGEGSNQVIGLQAGKPNSLNNSEEEDLWSLTPPTNSQQLDSEDEISKFPSEDPVLCIKSWGDSTRKRRMQRHRNPAFHKRQKSHKISLSKLQS